MIFRLRMLVVCQYASQMPMLEPSQMHSLPVLERIERAIALGCCRKYVSLLNGTDSDTIFSFAYFRDVIDEVCDSEVPTGYWNYVMPELEHLEKKWIARSNPAADAEDASAAGPKNKETR